MPHHSGDRPACALSARWEKLAELEKRHPSAENKNVIEFVLPSNDSKRKINKSETNSRRRLPLTLLMERSKKGPGDGPPDPNSHGCQGGKPSGDSAAN
jgi:hypothetical protein